MFNMQRCLSVIEHDDFDAFKFEALKFFSCFSFTENNTFELYDSLKWIINTITIWDRGSYIRWVLETTKNHHTLFSFITDPGTTTYGKSLIVKAAGGNHTDVLRAVIPFIGVQDNVQHTALDAAIRNRCIDAIQILIENGARISYSVYYSYNDWFTAKRIQEEYDEKRAACRRAIAALNRLFRRGGAPRDMTQHFLRNYVWTQKRNTVWLKETSSQKRLKF